MEAAELSLLDRREALVADGKAALEAALPNGVPPRGVGRRTVWDVLLGHLAVTDVREALRGIAAGAGGELRPSKAGNMAFCSAESSALMAVNFLAPFASREGLLGADPGDLRFERELPVSGVVSRVHPHLDCVLTSDTGTYAFECKTLEPWRDERKISISPQYDEPAAKASPKTRALLDELRSGKVSYRWLDAPQLVKHLLGIHSALDLGRLPSPAALILLFWRPSDPGPHAQLFDQLETEFADFAGRLDDQPVSLIALNTTQLLEQWSKPNSPPWLARHAASCRERYDRPLPPEKTIASPPAFVAWADRWIALAKYTGRDVPHLADRIAGVAQLWTDDVPPGWQRQEDKRLLTRAERYLRVHHRTGQPKPGSEHELERQILDADPGQVSTSCFGARLIDGINAVPLARDTVTGKRAGNVEADMLLLTQTDSGYRLLLVEAKTGSNNAWYAAIESLRQLRLFTQSASAQRIMARRNPGIPDSLPVTAVVLAPPTFYASDGARGRAIQPTFALLATLRQQFGIDCRLATWNLAERRVDHVLETT